MPITIVSFSICFFVLILKGKHKFIMTLKIMIIMEEVIKKGKIK